MRLVVLTYVDGQVECSAPRRNVSRPQYKKALKTNVSEKYLNGSAPTERRSISGTVYV